MKDDKFILIKKKFKKIMQTSINVLAMWCVLFHKVFSFQKSCVSNVILKVINIHCSSTARKMKILNILRNLLLSNIRSNPRNQKYFFPLFGKFMVNIKCFSKVSIGYYITIIFDTFVKWLISCLFKKIFLVKNASGTEIKFTGEVNCIFLLWMDCCSYYWK